MPTVRVAELDSMWNNEVRHCCKKDRHSELHSSNDKNDGTVPGQARAEWCCLGCRQATVGVPRMYFQSNLQVSIRSPIFVVFQENPVNGP